MPLFIRKDKSGAPNWTVDLFTLIYWCLSLHSDVCRWYYSWFGPIVAWTEHSQSKKLLTGSSENRHLSQTCHFALNWPLFCFESVYLRVCVCVYWCVLHGVCVLCVPWDHHIKAFPDLSYFCIPHPAHWHGHHTWCSQDTQNWTHLHTHTHTHRVSCSYCLVPTWIRWLPLVSWLDDKQRRLRSHSRLLPRPALFNWWKLRLSSVFRKHTQAPFWQQITVNQQNSLLSHTQWMQKNLFAKLRFSTGRCLTSPSINPRPTFEVFLA